MRLPLSTRLWGPYLHQRSDGWHMMGHSHPSTAPNKRLLTNRRRDVFEGILPWGLPAQCRLKHTGERSVLCKLQEELNGLLLIASHALRTCYHRDGLFYFLKAHFDTLLFMALNVSNIILYTCSFIWSHEWYIKLHDWIYMSNMFSGVCSNRKNKHQQLIEI